MKQTTFRKRTTVITTSDDSFKTGGSSESRSRGEAIYMKKTQPMIPDELVQSEKSYDSESDIDLDAFLLEEQEEEERKERESKILESVQNDSSRQAGVGDDFLDELLNNNAKEKDDVAEKKEAEDEDMIQLIDFSEHQFIRYAQEKLVENKILLNEKSSKALEYSKRKELIEQRVLSEVKPLNFGMHEPNLRAILQTERPTCIAVSDEVVVVGTSSGTFWAYNRETCRLYGRFHDESSEFSKNAVTCIHIHPLRTEYVVVGFHGGQFMICDLSLLDKNNLIKPKKFVKDHHRGVPLVSVKFCDWFREREVSEESKGAPKT